MLGARFLDPAESNFTVHIAGVAGRVGSKGRSVGGRGVMVVEQMM